jgi:copper chaperone CopZ
MKTALAITFIWLFSSIANAEYRKINMTVFGMDCAPCAHAIHVSMTGIQGVNTVDVDLNTGLVNVALTPGNTAGMGLFQAAIKKNGFTYKGATVVARGTLTGPANAPVFEVTGTNDHYALTPAAQSLDLTTLLGKTVEVDGLLSQAKKNQLPDTLSYKTITEAQ